MVARTRISLVVVLGSLVGAACSEGSPAGTQRADALLGRSTQNLLPQVQEFWQGQPSRRRPRPDSIRNPRPIEQARDAIGLPVGREHFQVVLRDDNSVVSFDCDWGHAQWVSWTLSPSDLGGSGRSNNFHQESRLPSDCLSPLPEHYRGSGYDRGHMTPSGDRTSDRSRNEAVFSMANIVPQASQVNQKAWNDLEMWSRAQLSKGVEAIVYSGTVGSLGRMLGSGINIPAATWKVVVLLPRTTLEAAPRNGHDWSSQRPSKVVAVMFDNDLSSRVTPLSEGLTTVDEIESVTGVDFLVGLDPQLESELESTVATVSGVPNQHR